MSQSPMSLWPFGPKISSCSEAPPHPWAPDSVTETSLPLRKKLLGETCRSHARGTGYRWDSGAQALPTTSTRPTLQPPGDPGPLWEQDLAAWEFSLLG